MQQQNPYRTPGREPLQRPPRAWRRIVRGPLRLLGVLTLLAASSFNMAMMIAVLALIFAAAPLLWTGAALCTKNPTALARRGLYVVVLVAMAPICCCTIGFQHWLLNARMAGVIEAVESRRESTGVLPAALDELDVATPRCNAIGGLGMKPLYHQRDGVFSLTCITFGFNHHTYRSEKQRWENWD